MKLSDLLEIVKEKVDEGKNNILRDSVITYRVDHKTTPKKKYIGQIFLHRESIVDIDKYIAVFPDDNEDIKETFKRLIKGS